MLVMQIHISMRTHLNEVVPSQVCYKTTLSKQKHETKQTDKKNPLQKDNGNLSEF